MEATVNMKMTPQELGTLVRALEREISIQKDIAQTRVGTPEFDGAMVREAKVKLIQAEDLHKKLV